MKGSYAGHLVTVSPCHLVIRKGPRAFLLPGHAVAAPEPRGPPRTSWVALLPFRGFRFPRLPPQRLGDQAPGGRAAQHGNENFDRSHATVMPVPMVLPELVYESLPCSPTTIRRASASSRAMANSARRQENSRMRMKYGNALRCVPDCVRRGRMAGVSLRPSACATGRAGGVWRDQDGRRDFA